MEFFTSVALRAQRFEKSKQLSKFLHFIECSACQTDEKATHRPGWWSARAAKRTRSLDTSFATLCSDRCTCSAPVTPPALAVSFGLSPEFAAFWSGEAAQCPKRSETPPIRRTDRILSMN